MLEKILNKYDSDKGTKVKYSHHYYEIYEQYFESKRYENIKLFEVGIYKGTSQSAWIEYFPNAEIYSIDIFKRMKPNTVSILKHERMHWLKADSMKPTLPALIKKEWGNDIKFDFIIDDGLHFPKANLLTFQNLISFLSDDGVYFIEDVWPLHIMNSEELKHKWVQRNLQHYNEKNMNEFLKYIHEYNVEEFDLRNISKVPDSYIFKIMK